VSSRRPRPATLALIAVIVRDDRATAEFSAKPVDELVG